MFCDYLIAYVTSKLAEIDWIENSEKLATSPPPFPEYSSESTKRYENNENFPKRATKNRFFIFLCVVLEKSRDKSCVRTFRKSPKKIKAIS